MKRYFLLLFCAIFWSTIQISSCAIYKPNNSTSTSSRSTVADKDQRLRNDIVNYARKQVGSKYKYAGKQPGGFDCSGLICHVMSKYDYTITGSSATQESYGKPIPVAEVQAGDLIFFRRSRKGRVFHVALVVSNTTDGITVVHATSSRGVVIDNISQNSWWAPKISTARDVLSTR